MLAVLLLNLERFKRPVEFGGRQFPQYPTIDVSTLPTAEQVLKKKRKPEKKFPFVGYTKKEVKEKVERISTVAEDSNVPQLKEKLKETLTPFSTGDIIGDKGLDIPNLETSNLDYDSLLNNEEAMESLNSLSEWADEEEFILLLVS